MKFSLFAAAAALFGITSAQADELASQVLAEMNLARTQPAIYAQFVGEHAASGRTRASAGAVREAVNFLRKAQPLPPLEWSDGISRAALSHVLDTGSRGRTGHTGSRGQSPWQRISRFGKWTGSAAENISYGVRDARGIVIQLIIDEGVPRRGHRRNIFGAAFRVAGVATGGHTRYGTMCVMDFAGGFVEANAGRIVADAAE
jgi:uncharacterized protein YkwD